MTFEPYADKLGPADFRVAYRWLFSEAGTSPQLPFQHMRCDFSYEGDDIAETGVFMIWPEFENNEGIAISATHSIPLEGEASMWIQNRSEYERYHRDRLSIGVMGFLVMGSRRLASIRVIELVRLQH